MGRRGPKRRPGKRYPCGKLIPPATRPLGPTLDLVAKRISRFVIAGAKPEKDLRLAESWLGCLYAADVIDESQYDAGTKYHGLYKTLFPQGFPGSSLDIDMIVDGQPFDPIDDTRLEDIELAWAATERILTALGRRTHDLIKNLCVYGRFQRFIDVMSPRTKEGWKADVEDKTRVIEGLEALVRAYGLRMRKAA